ncbi:hypothetical protein [Paraflavitalea speifideaquila]|uniref:hypothetical protein n=1 Tax=Paraflavitalea speifideaquila TaxID=3076558 RepID=UPI0028EA0A7A|nr:hypothetical protein [Paraflavitalea speifideiaquila]
MQRKEEDSIEVVTILQDKAQLMINDKAIQVPAGFTVSRIAQQKGAVRVSIIRNGITLKKFVTPEQITNKPMRADRLTYSWSTETDHYRRAILGELSTTAATVE